MGDDVVQLRLSLNEETVKQVQNRIQNIVNKLNNRRVNITVNTGNLDNALCKKELIVLITLRLE